MHVYKNVTLITDAVTLTTAVCDTVIALEGIKTLNKKCF